VIPELYTSIILYYCFYYSYIFCLVQTRVDDNGEGTEEGYDSSRDEVSSISSYNPANANNFELSSLRNSLSNQSFASARLSVGPVFPQYKQLPQLSVSEILEESGPGKVSAPSRYKYSRSLSANEVSMRTLFTILLVLLELK
jgi:RAB6A-GEF complex partner protein 2